MGGEAEPDGDEPGAASVGLGLAVPPGIGGVVGSMDGSGSVGVGVVGAGVGVGIGVGLGVGVGSGVGVAPGSTVIGSATPGTSAPAQSSRPWEWFGSVKAPAMVGWAWIVKVTLSASFRRPPPLVLLTVTTWPR